VGVFIDVNRAGLGTSHRIGSDPVPDRRQHDDLFFFSKLPQTSGNDHRIGSAGNMVSVVFNRPDGNDEGDSTLFCIFDLIKVHVN